MKPNLYPEMNAKLVDLLRISDEPISQYAAARIEQLEAKVERLKSGMEDLFQNREKWREDHMLLTVKINKAVEALEWISDAGTDYQSINKAIAALQSGTFDLPEYDIGELDTAHRQMHKRNERLKKELEESKDDRDDLIAGLLVYAEEHIGSDDNGEHAKSVLKDAGVVWSE